MQNQFFGDRHDFYKYFFLKEIARCYSLGIHWCLVPDEGGNAGNTGLTDKEKTKDPDLYTILTNAKGQNVENIKPYFSKHLNHGAVFFTKLHEDYSNDFLYEQEAIACLSNQDIIYFDPDNGIEVPSTNNNNKYKFISYHLLQRFWQMGKSLIIYQHEGRNIGQTHGKIKTLYNLLQKEPSIITAKKGASKYICVINNGRLIDNDICDGHYIMKDIFATFRYEIKYKEYAIENWEGTGGIG
jgi:hypothetical protein